MGLTWQNSKATLWMLELLVPCVAVIWLSGLVFAMLIHLASGAALHALSFGKFFFFEKFGYVLGALLQDFVIAYCFVIFQELYGNQGKAFRYTSRLFWGCHTPNLLLMLITKWGGKRLCWIFAEHRNLWTVVLLHGTIGAAIAAFWPHWTVVAGIGFIKLIFGSQPAA
jgi:hypothetical protein